MAAVFFEKCGQPAIRFKRDTTIARGIRHLCD
jgi:hypothetical protein